MKKWFLCVLAMLIVTAVVLAQAKKKAPTGNVEQQIKQLEENWAKEMATNDASIVEKYEAPDIVSTDPVGKVTDRTEDVQAVKSGDFKVQSLNLSDVKVQTYGNTAVATGTGDMKGSYKGHDISGNYRFTDTWVKRNGKWQVVATQVTKVMEEGQKAEAQQK